MDYYFKPSAVRDLKKLPKTIQQRILRKLEYFLRSKNPLTFAERLKDTSLGEFRFRIGDYRVIFDLEPKGIVILKIGDRKDIYR